MPYEALPGLPPRPPRPMVAKDAGQPDDLDGRARDGPPVAINVRPRLHHVHAIRLSAAGAHGVGEVAAGGGTGFVAADAVG